MKKKQLDLGKIRRAANVFFVLSLIAFICLFIGEWIKSKRTYLTGSNDDLANYVGGFFVFSLAIGILLRYIYAEGMKERKKQVEKGWDYKSKEVEKERQVYLKAKEEKRKEIIERNKIERGEELSSADEIEQKHKSKREELKEKLKQMHEERRQK
jgi:hypothetical protein